MTKERTNICMAGSVFFLRRGEGFHRRSDGPHDLWPGCCPGLRTHLGKKSFLEPGPAWVARLFLCDNKDMKIPAISTNQMGEVDRLVVETYHASLIQMMENAGRSLAEMG
jgi:hypothetical protein